MREEDAIALVEAFRPMPEGVPLATGMALSPALGSVGGVADGGAASSPKVAVGAAPGVKKTDWRVAIRGWTRRDVDFAIAQMKRHRAPESELEARVTGRIRAPRRRASSSPFKSRVRPLEAGYSAGHHAITVGTLGAFVEDERGRLHALSNNHVFANSNDAARGDDILQPGRSDRGRRGADAVLKLSRFVRIKSRGNKVDAALARPIDGVEPSSLDLPKIGAVAGWWTERPTVREVQKVGRTTGYTKGLITALALRNLPVDYDGFVAYFDDVLEVRGTHPRPPMFCDGGDSGSLVVDRDNYAVGLLFAGDDDGITFVNPIAEVLAALKAQLVRG